MVGINSGNGCRPIACGIKTVCIKKRKDDTLFPTLYLSLIAPNYCISLDVNVDAKEGSQMWACQRDPSA